MRHFLLSYGNTIAAVFGVDSERSLEESLRQSIADSDFTVTTYTVAMMSQTAFDDGYALRDFGDTRTVLAEITSVEAADIAAHSLTFTC